MTGFLYRQQRSGAPHPRFPVKLSGFRALHAPFLKERRTRGPVQGSVQEIRGISLVFREMWDTTELDVKTLSVVIRSVAENAQFRGLFLEMFFDRGRSRSKSGECASFRESPL